MPSIRNLQAFLAAARLGSFAAAGQDVGLTAAAVGLQVRALEAELGLSLFDRSGRAVVLNTDGRRLEDRKFRLGGGVSPCSAAGFAAGLYFGDGSLSDRVDNFVKGIPGRLGP